MERQQFETLELEQRQSVHRVEDAEPQNLQQTQQLKPVDGGKDAWIVLIAGIIFEAFFWGFPMCFGVFQNYYTSRPEYQADQANVALIGTLAQGLYYLGAPLSATLTKRFPKHQRLQIYLGWAMCILGLLLASFANTIPGLIGTQGFLYGLGFATLTYPIISMLNEWWVARKGMAFGLISASSGLTGATMPFIIEALLARYGQQTTLRACAVAMAVLTAPLLFLFKGRLPASESAALARTDWGFLKRPLFWVFGSAILIQGLGFFLPPVFLPSYAAGLNISSVNGALLLSIMSIAQVIGQFVFGYMSDKNFSVNILGVICCVAAATSSLAFWGLAKSMALLIVFSLVYGFFGFGFVTMRVAMGRAVSDDPSTVFATYVIFVFVQGVGNILLGPLSAALMTGPTVRERFATGRYEGLVYLTGGTSALAALIMAGWQGLRAL